MTNRKSTKRALLGSIMAMVLCLAMLIGATFAWFTDTASTGVNKIQAGNLDVALEMKAVSYTHLDVYKRQDHGAARDRGDPHPAGGLRVG